MQFGALIHCPFSRPCCLSSRKSWQMVKCNHSVKFFKTLFLSFKVGRLSLYVSEEVTSPLFSRLQNEGISCWFIPALIFYHSPISGPGLFPRIHSRVSYTGSRVLSPGTTDFWELIILCCGAVLGIVGCLSASLCSIHWMLVTPLLES